MKPTMQYECMNDECRTIIIDTRNRDGLNCPRCDGPVNPKPFKPIKPEVSERALYVLRNILLTNKSHCFDLSPEQIETVLSIGDEYEAYNAK